MRMIEMEMIEKKSVEILKFIFEFIKNPRNVDEKTGNATICIMDDFGEAYTLVVNGSHTHSSYFEPDFDQFIDSLHGHLIGGYGLGFVKKKEEVK